MEQLPRPPRPPRRRDAPLEEVPVVVAEPEGSLVELDEGARVQLADAIARAISAELGRVRISSVAPPPPSELEPPRSSIRVAANVGGKVGKWSIKWGVLGSGALALVGQVIVWTMKPEYAAPLGQAVKLIASVIVAAVGGGPPSGDSTP
jgi:hypothetical protein